MKNSRVWFIVILIALVTTLGAYFTSGIVESNKTTFAEGGYVLVSDLNAEADKVYFKKDSKYSFSAQNGVVFEDIQNTKQSVPSDSFFHVSDHYVTSLVTGVFMDLQETGSDFISHYQTTPGMLIENSNKVTVISDTDEYKYEQIVWKLNDNRFIILSKHLKAHFGEDDVRDCGDFVELHYLDRGVVQIITENNIWQTASAEVYIEALNNIEIYPILEKIVNKETGKESFLNQLVVDSDDNMHLRDSQEKNINNIVPHFNVVTEDGASGKTGESGSDGNKGLFGFSGMDAGTTSSSKTEIPVFNITEWDVTATSLKGAVMVTDTNAVLSDKPDDYAVYLTEPGSTVKIPAIPCDKDYREKDHFSFMGDETTYFKFEENTLKPDTEYTLVIRGKYEMGSYNTGGGAGADNFMNRDFVTRTFYTNSLGVSLAKEIITTDMASLLVNKTDYSTAKQATVYLLTEDQNKLFTEEEAIKANVDKNLYLYSADVTFNASGDKDEQKVTFGGPDEAGNYAYHLDPDTRYIARVVIKYADGNHIVSSLSKQNLVVQTLKRAPQMNGYPNVASNRSNKAFEIYSASINDPDNAIVSYNYEIYRNDGNGTPVKTINVDPNTFAAKNYTTLYIDDSTICFNVDYFVVETITYNDNEKLVNLTVNSDNQIVKSSLFSLMGSQMPSVFFRYLTNNDGTPIGQEYERIRGWLVIAKNESSLKIDGNHPVEVTMAAEGYFKKQLKFTGGQIVDNGNEYLMYIDENSLRKNTSYRLTVSAHVDYDEDNNNSTVDYKPMILGNIVVNTTDTPTLNAIWTSTGATGHAISRRVKLQAYQPDEDISYIAKTLTSVTFELYEGAYYKGATPIASYSLNDPNDDEYTNDLYNDIFVNGVEISEANFNKSASELTATSYSFLIKGVYDYTISKENSGNISHYVNEFEVMNPNSGSIGKLQQPPALPRYGEEDSCVSAIAITKKQAREKYGITSFGDDISEDSIVGYDILANYDDFGKLAREVIYYGYEANYFHDKAEVEGADIYGGGFTELFNIPLKVTTPGHIPSLVVWFGVTNLSGDEGNLRQPGQVFTVNNQQMIYAGNPTISGTDKVELISGMSRGFKYVFAYRMRYSSQANNQADKIYPQDHSDYQSWNISHDGKPFLALHSPVMSAPKTLPTFQAYPLEQTADSLTIKYRYVDPDDLIVYSTDAPESNSNFYFNNNNGAPKGKVNIKACDSFDSDACEWGIMSFNNVSSITQNEVQMVTVNVQGAAYIVDYSSIDEGANQMPVVYTTPWNSLTQLSNDFKLKIDDTTEMTDHNYMLISLTSESNSMSMNKVVGVEMIFKDKNGNERVRTFAELDSTTGTYQARLPLDRFANVLGLDLYPEARVYYDSGISGWGERVDQDGVETWKEVYAENYDSMPTAEFVALQQFSQFGYGRYLSKSISTTSVINSTKATNSIFKLYKDVVTILDEERDIIRGTFYGNRTFRTNVGLVLDYSNRGMIYSNYPETGVVPKKLYYHEIKGKDNISTKSDITGNNKIVINSIIPSGSYAGFETEVSKLNIYNFLVNGKDQIYAPDNKPYIYIKVIKKGTEEEDVTTSTLDNRKVTIGGEQYIRWPINDSSTVYPAYIDGLSTEEADYELRFYVYKAKGKLVPMLDATSTSSKELVLPFTTKSKVDMAGLSFTYNQENYRSKTYRLSFSVSQNTDLRAEYVFYKKNGEDWDLLLTHKQLVDRNIINENTTNILATSVDFNLTPGNNPVLPGNIYKIQVNLYSTKEGAVGPDGKPLLVSKDEQSSYEFMYPNAPYPTAFINVVPEFEAADEIENRKYGYRFSVSALGDDAAVVMGPSVGKYAIRIYKEDGTLLKDEDGITLKDINAGNKVIKLSALYGMVFDSNKPTPEYMLMGLKPATRYRFEVYAAVDIDGDANNDLIAKNSPYVGYREYSITELYEDSVALKLFDETPAFRNCFKLSELVQSTPDASGVSIGTTNSRINPLKDDELQLVYFNWSGLGNVDKIVASVSHSSGSPSLSAIDGTFTNLSTMLLPDSSTSGRWILTIPSDVVSLNKNGFYTITVKHYVGDEVVYTYSGILEK